MLYPTEFLCGIHLRPCAERVELEPRDKASETRERIALIITSVRCARGEVHIRTSKIREGHGTPHKPGFLTVLPNERSGNDDRIYQKIKEIHQHPHIPLCDIRIDKSLECSLRCANLSPKDAQIADLMRTFFACFKPRVEQCEEVQELKMVPPNCVFDDDGRVLDPCVVGDRIAIGRIYCRKYALAISDDPMMEKIVELGRMHMKINLCGFDVKDISFKGTTIPSTRRLSVMLDEYLAEVCIPSHIYVILLVFLEKIGMIHRIF